MQSGGGDMREAFLEKGLLYEAELIDTRRELHKIPEYDMNLPETVTYIKRKLSEYDITYREAGGGIIAEIKGENPGKTVVLRADIDALHIDEAGNKPYKSTHPGLMHACGHDGHAAILLTAARILNEEKDTIKGTVRLVFQPGEETGNGAVSMIEAGALDHADAAVSLHIGAIAGPDYPAGSLIIAPGAVSSGFDKFRIIVKGIGTHGAYPENGVDPIVAASHLVTAYSEIGFRELPAGATCVIDIGSFHSGVDHNSIPSEAVLTGTLRTGSEEVRAFVLKRMAEIGENICRAFRAEFSMEEKRTAFPVMNDPALVKAAFNAVAEALGSANLFPVGKHPFMAADDFGEYASRVPALYFFLHTNDPEQGIDAPNHSPDFEINEALLLKGVFATLAIAEAAMEM